jgi:hypothetical protein
MRSAFAIAATLVLVATPAFSANIFSYTGPRSVIAVDGHKYHVAIHPKQDLVMIQSTLGDAYSGKRPDQWPVSTWRGVAEALVTPLGCGISEVHSLGSPKGGTWEAAYVCPVGVDLRAIFKDQRKALEAGSPLTLTSAPATSNTSNDPAHP